ncbi:allophanate hydrolase subunit 1 family protein [Rhodococcus sp. MTM3W5.2]|nr:allophanate hydrolase subunit 1 family protein [Rhodococcus sp. MTM3W5.2]
MRLLDAGDGGVLAEFDDLEAVVAHYRALDANRPAGVVDLVPAARTILVRFDPGRTDRAHIARWLRETGPESGTYAETGALIQIPVHYDGPDLATVSALTGLGPDGVVAAHTGSDWTVAFAGFAPGSGTSSVAIPGCGCPAGTTPAPRCLRARSGWPASSPASTPGSRRAAGS